MMILVGEFGKKGLPHEFQKGCCRERNYELSGNRQH